MGTRKSRHNKGRKPRYKDQRWKRDPRPPHRLTDRVWEAYLGHLTTMSQYAVAKLPEMPSPSSFLLKRRRDPIYAQRAAEVMAGRSLQPKLLAQDVWQTFLAQLRSSSVKQLTTMPGMPDKTTVYRRCRRDPEFRRQLEAARPAATPRSIVCYPYITTRRNEHADILAINDIVPRAFPDQMRADICQEAMLAVLEGRTTIEELRQNKSKSAWFLRKFYQDNFEDAGRALSFSDREDDDRSYDEIASSRAAKDWHYGQQNELRSNFDTLRTFQPPTQIEDTWIGQVRRKQIELDDLSLSFDEVAELLSQRGGL